MTLTSAELDLEFEQAQKDIKGLSRAPDSNTLLELYGLFKQAKEGDCDQPKPSMLNMRAFAKHQAWEGKKGTPREAAMTSYIDLVSKLTA